MDKDYFDVIVLDINMPIMDGMEACRLIHKHFNCEVGPKSSSSSSLDLLRSLSEHKRPKDQES